ncbi:MAG: short-chain fatty acid transporter [Planctomycetota bacterium]|jgi:short-chain fatty acids transporter
MVSRLGLLITNAFRRIAPDPFVIAILLTALTLLLAKVRTDSSWNDLVGWWSGSTGVWGLLSFGMQMCLILVTGHALASSPPVSALLDRLAGLPRNGVQAVMLAATVAGTLSILNWGLGLIGGALIARRIGLGLERRGRSVHYPLLVAAGYVGLMMWHGGFSGTAPLKVTKATDLQELMGAGTAVEVIPINETILSPMNLVITGGLLILAPLFLALLAPRETHQVELPSRYLGDITGDPAPEPEPAKPLVPRLLEDTPIVTLLLLALIAWWAFGYYFPATDGGPSGILSLDPNTVNLTMLMLGLAMHGTPKRYVRAVDEAVRGCGGIILQFPLYAGIMGVMRESGLTAQLADQLASTADETTLPILTFISAGVVNLFVPSGGGQWAIQGQIALEAGAAAGVKPASMVMAVAYGDQLTNMLQPFWALPILAITGVKARDIVGYTAMLMLVAFVWITAMLLLMA